MRVAGAVALASCALRATAVGPVHTAGPTMLSVPLRTVANPSIATWGNLAAVTFSASDDTGRTDIYVATSNNGGSSFKSPQRVNLMPGDPRASREQPPRVAVVAHRGGESQLHLVWVAARGDDHVLMTTGTADNSRRFGGS